MNELEPIPTDGLEEAVLDWVAARVLGVGLTKVLQGVEQVNLTTPRDLSLMVQALRNLVGLLGDAKAYTNPDQQDMTDKVKQLLSVLDGTADS